MYGPKSRLYLVFFLFLSSLSYARPVNFDSRDFFGINLHSGITSNPNLTYFASSQTTSSSYTYFLGFEPFLSFENFIILPSIEFYFPPAISAGGLDSTRSLNYSERGALTLVTMGGKLLFIPYVSENYRFRTYVGISAGIMNSYIRNTRDYKSAAGITTNTYVDRMRGNTTYVAGIAGLEFFLIQNYTLALEGGYRKSDIGALNYVSNNDRENTQSVNGKTVRKSNGQAGGVDFSGYFLGLGIGLHF